MFNIKLITAAVLLLLASAVQAGTVEMTVDGLVCAFCAQGIEKSLRKQSATADVFVSLKHGIVGVGLKDGADIPDATLRNVLREAGYSIRTIQRSDASLDDLRARTKP